MYYHCRQSLELQSGCCAVLEQEEALIVPRRFEAGQDGRQDGEQGTQIKGQSKGDRQAASAAVILYI